MRIVISSDHGGYEQKEKLKKDLKILGHVVIDMGVQSEASGDYPDFIYPAAKAVAKGDFDRGIILCGTGIGASIVANKVRGIRCALVTDTESARLTREHNDSNILALSGRTVDYDLNFHIAQIWLDTDFSHDPRHERRIEKVSQIEIEEERE